MLSGVTGNGYRLFVCKRIQSGFNDERRTRSVLRGVTTLGTIRDLKHADHPHAPKSCNRGLLWEAACRRCSRRGMSGKSRHRSSPASRLPRSGVCRATALRRRRSGASHRVCIQSDTYVLAPFCASSRLVYSDERSASQIAQTAGQSVERSICAIVSENPTRPGNALKRMVTR